MDGLKELKTRVFDLMWEKYASLPQLARAMGISQSQIYRVKDGERKINAAFIVGAVKAFPEYKLDDLFYVGPQGRSDAAAMLRTGEVAQLLGIHPDTVRGWDRRGMLKSYRIGSRGERGFRQEDIDDFLRKRQIE